VITSGDGRTTNAAHPEQDVELGRRETRHRNVQSAVPVEVPQRDAPRIARDG
jgi:hypothetical protein